MADTSIYNRLFQSNPVGAFIQGQSAGSDVQNALLQREALQQGMDIKQQNFDEESQRIQMKNDIIDMSRLKFTAQKDIGLAREQLQSLIDKEKQIGGETEEEERLLSYLDNNEFETFTNEVDGLIDYAEGVYNQFYGGGAGGDSLQAKNQMKIFEETRAAVRKEVKQSSDAAFNVSDNWNKLNKLGGEVRGDASIGKKPNRTSVAQMLVSLVKLNDPNSAVLEGEMSSALNATDPLAAVINVARGVEDKTGALNSVLQKIDTLGPENINVDDVLATGKALVSSNIPSIVSRYNEADEQAQNLTSEGYNSIFTKTTRERISGLEGILDSFAPKQETTQQTTDSSIPTITTQAQYDALPSGAEFIENGKRYRKP